MNVSHSPILPREPPRDYLKPDPVQLGEKLAKEQRKLVDNARKNAKVVDEVKVGLIENLDVKKKYDIIFDHMGPLEYSLHRERVIEQYAKMLPKGGLLITNPKHSGELAFVSPKVFRQISGTSHHVILEKV